MVIRCFANRAVYLISGNLDWTFCSLSSALSEHYTKLSSQFISDSLQMAGAWTELLSAALTEAGSELLSKI